MAVLKSLLVSGASRFIGTIEGVISRAISDEDGLRIRDNYKKIKTLVLSSSNVSTYYDSTEHTLTLDQPYDTVIVTTPIVLTNIKGGVATNAYRLTLVNVSGNLTFRQDGAGAGRISKYVYGYYSNSSTSISSTAPLESFVDLVYYNNIWYMKGY